MLPPRKSREPLGHFWLRCLAALFRELFSLAPKVGLLPKPKAPMGLTAIVRASGDEPWLSLSLRSIAPYADEILLLDHGLSPKARARLTELKLPHLRRFELPHLDFLELCNFGLKEARFRYLLRWDADFVAHTSGDYDFAHVRRFLLNLDPERYVLLTIPTSEVAGDLFHQFPDLRIRYDGQIHTAGSGARYIYDERDVDVARLEWPLRILRSEKKVRLRLESLKVPKFYRLLTWPLPAYLHVNIKPRRKLLFRYFWLEWLKEKGRFPSWDDYVRHRITAWGVSCLEEAERFYLRRYLAGLVPYNREISGPYPELIRPELEKPLYRVLYRDGRPYDREEPDT